MCLKASVFIATSLDGFIARADGALDWLDAANATVPHGEDCGYGSFMESIDLLIMGRKTFEQVLTFDQWPYGSKKVLVLGRHKIPIPKALTPTVSHSDESPKQIQHRLSAENISHIYIDGGNTIQRFFATGIITDITITIIPVVLGCGISLFGSVDKDILLELISTKTYDFGFVQLYYKVKSKGVRKND